MATLPKATTTISEVAGASASGIETVCVWAAVPTNADAVPRLYGNAAAIYAQHGYSEGVEYAALHAARTGKPILFQGLPIATAGVVGRFDDSGNTGTSVVTVAAGASGVLAEHEGVVRVKRGGTRGTDQIVIEYSCDGGVTYKTHRLGTGTSFAVPHVGVTVSFGAGMLAAGDVVLTWKGTSPLPDATGLTSARTKLANQLKQCRSVILVGDCPSSVLAAAFLSELQSLETANERFVYGRASVVDRLPEASLSSASVRLTGAPSLTFEADDNTITRSGGSWVSDGFVTGDTVTITGTSSNNVTRVATVTSANVLTLAGDALTDEVTSGATIVGSPTVTFANSGDTLTRSRGSWLDDGFRDGDTVTIAGTSGGTNDGSFVVDALTATVMTLATGGVGADESAKATDLTITAGQTKAAWMAAVEAAFASVDGDEHLSLAAGRGRVASPFAGWVCRRPVSWAESCREYQHDVHVSTMRKEDGPVGFDLYDTDGQLVEWDDRVDGGGASAAKFSSFRTWANGPGGAFITQSLTRAAEGSVLSRTNNVAVTYLACTIVQIAAERVIGRSLVLNADGTATKDALATIAAEVNADLTNSLLANLKGEGPRASSATWTPSADDVLNVAEPVLTGTLILNLNGTIHSVNTTVRVLSGGLS